MCSSFQAPRVQASLPQTSAQGEPSQPPSVPTDGRQLASHNPAGHPGPGHSGPFPVLQESPLKNRFAVVHRDTGQGDRKHMGGRYRGKLRYLLQPSCQLGPLSLTRFQFRLLITQASVLQLRQGQHQNRKKVCTDSREAWDWPHEQEAG